MVHLIVRCRPKIWRVFDVRSCFIHVGSWNHRWIFTPDTCDGWHAIGGGVGRVPHVHCTNSFNPTSSSIITRKFFPILLYTLRWHDPTVVRPLSCVFLVAPVTKNDDLLYGVNLRACNTPNDCHCQLLTSHLVLSGLVLRWSFSLVYDWHLRVFSGHFKIFGC